MILNITKPNKKGFSKITIVFYAIIFMILWAMFIAGQLTTWGNAAVINGGLTGFEALFYENLNLFIGGMFLIFILAVGIYGGGGNY